MNKQLTHYGRQLAQFSSVVMITRIIVLLEAFIALKIFTNLLQVSEYGLFELWYSLVLMLSFFASGGFPSAINRYLIRFDSENKSKNANDLVYTALMMVFLINLTAVAFLFMSFFADFKLVDSPNYLALLISISILSIFMSSNHLMIGIIRARQMVKWYAIFNIFKAFVSLGLEVFLVVFLKFRVFGMLLGLSGGEACGYFVFFIRFYRGRGFGHFSRHRLIELLKFGLPQTFTLSLGTLINFIIAFLIFSYASSEELAYFALGNSVSGLFNIIIYGITTAYGPIIGKLYEQGLKNDLKSFTNIVMRFYLVLSVPIILLIISLSPTLIVLFSNENYIPGVVVIPLLLISLFFIPLGNITGMGGFLKYRMDLIAIAYTIGAGSTLLIAFLIIPLYGIIGAAIVLIVRSLLESIFKFTVSQYLYKIEFETLKLVKILIAIVLGVLPILFPNPFGILVFFVSISLYLFLVFLLRGITVSEFKSVFRFLFQQKTKQIKVKIE